MFRRDILAGGLVSVISAITKPLVVKYKLRPVTTSECLDHGVCRPLRLVNGDIDKYEFRTHAECLFCGSVYRAPTTNRDGPCLKCGVYHRAG